MKHKPIQFQLCGIISNQKYTLGTISFNQKKEEMFYLLNNKNRNTSMTFLNKQLLTTPPYIVSFHSKQAQI